jgi:radical SAM-linked protein
MRIRFRKEGDLRLISHRDLARVWERMFRRADLSLAMSEGFHPKAKLSFPSALSLGTAGTDEVLEVELTEALPVDEVARRLEAQAPPGLGLSEIGWVPPGTAKAQVSRTTYEVSLPPEKHAVVQEAIDRFLAETSHPFTRPQRGTPIDIRADVQRLELRDGTLRMTLKHRREASVRPRDILEVLGLSDLEASGHFLTRSKVELAS